MALGINKDAFKSWQLWAAVVAAVVGQLLAHGAIMDGSQAAMYAGWVLSLIAALSGHKTLTLPEAPGA